MSRHSKSRIGFLSYPKPRKREPIQSLVVNAVRPFLAHSVPKLYNIAFRTARGLFVVMELTPSEA